MNIYPVNPAVLETGELFSLSKFLKPENSIPIMLEEGDSAFTSFKVSSEQISISAAAKLSVSSVFNGSIKSNDIGLIFDAIAYTDKYAASGANDTPIIMTRWGAGMRVALKATVLEGSVDASFSSIAASAQLNNSKATYEIQGLGLGLQALTEILDDLPPLGEFGLQAYSKLTGGIYEALKKYIMEHPGQLKAVPIAVGLQSPIETDSILEGRSVYLAVYWKNRQKSKKWLLEKYPEIDSAIADKVYELNEDQIVAWLDK